MHSPVAKRFLRARFMGMISISVQGSFGSSNCTKQFTAMTHGHASAVADAIAFLSGSLLPNAISLDHEIANDGDGPDRGFGSRGVQPNKKLATVK